MQVRMSFVGGHSLPSLIYSCLIICFHSTTRVTDDKVPMDWSTFPPQPGRLVCATPAKLNKLYQQQLSDPGYRQLIKSNVTIFGTFDGKSR